jgi:acyl-CoA thioester hydrolase
MMTKPEAGILNAGEHVYPLRVYYADTDAGGVVYHATYLAYAERARAEMLRCAGVLDTRLPGEGGVIFVVRHAEIDYQSPARLDEALTVVSRITQLGGASLTIEQRVRRDDRDLVTIIVRLVCIDGKFQPVRVPQALRDVFTPWLADV